MECGCSVPQLAGSLATTCGGTGLLFMALLDSFLLNKCDISEICSRVTHKEKTDFEYDYVVIGGGSGGATAAGVLAQENMGKVLLIEAGGDEPVGTQVPSLLLGYFDNPDVDWQYKTEPEPVGCQGYPEKRCDWMRGKVLGGCGVLNGMMYMRGVPRDYDNWAAAGNPGWSYKDVLPFFKQQEDNQQIGSLVDAKYHGTGGRLTVAQFPDHPKFADDILIAAKQSGYPVTKDLNGQDLVGFTIAQTNNRNGTRLSAARAFLRPERNNPNLHVTLHSLATKIVFQNVNGKKVAKEVHFNSSGIIRKVKVRKEVIVAGGAVNSPQLLMLSGVGPRDELQKVGIPVFHELPGVGKNLKNHVSFFMSFALNKEPSINDLDWSEALRYILKREGPLTSTGMSQMTARLNSKYADPSGNYPDIQLFFSGFLAKCSPTGEAKSYEDPENPTAPKHIGMAPVYLHPKSKGHISLKSNNPNDHPLIYANYLTEPEDVKTLIEAIRVAQKIANSTYLVEKYGIEMIKDDYGEECNQFPFDSDDYWSCAVKHSTGPENHQIGTCKMGPDSDRMAVVDQKLKIKGIENVRVMDASVIPELPSGNTAAMIMMLAQRGVLMIKEEQGAPELGNRGGFQGSATNVVGASRPNSHQFGRPHHGPHQGYPSDHSNHHSYEFHRRHPEIPSPWGNNQGVTSR